MSLDYNFRITTSLAPEQVLQVAMEALALRPASESPRGEIRGPGFLLAAGPVAPMSKAMMEEARGFAPSVDLQFGLEAHQRHTAMTAMLHGVLAVLRHVSGDAALLFGGETVLLLRRHGQLLLDASTGVWTPERLALVSAPYAMQALPTL
ncbi:SitI3 family protein [Myxococcus stipitatus]|uniref:SitI3 family protein n=1 Tax=Myxococcus stipitatus TaxID=83455 RepID=UPI0030CEBC56